MKKILSVLLAATMALSVTAIVPFSAGAAEINGSNDQTEATGYTESAPSEELDIGATQPPSLQREEYELEIITNDPQKPAAPALSLSNTVNGLTAAWDAVDNAEYYRVFYRTADAGEDWTSFDTDDTSCNIPDAESGTLYFVKVQSFGADDLEGECSDVKDTVYIARAEITSLSFDGSANSLAWSFAGGANKYQIAKKRVGDKAYTYYTTAANSYTDKNVVTANTYCYQVRAMYVTGNGTTYGAWSSTKSVVTLTKANVSLSNKSNGIRAQWNAVKGASRYAVYFKSADDANWSSASTTNTYYPLLNVKSGKLYYVQVRPVAGNISGAYSKVKAMTFIGQPAVTLSNGIDGVKVSCNAVAGANRYQIAKKKVGASSYSYYYSDNPSFVDNNVAGNTNYHYQVRAMYATENNGTAYGAWSATKTILRLTAPASVSLSNKSNGMRVEWSKVPGAVKYAVYIKAATASSWQSATTTNTYYPMLTVKSGVLYYVQVRPLGNGVNGPYSKPKSMTYIGPANLTLSMSGSDLKLGWNSVPGANKFQIARLKKGNSAYDYFYTTGTSYIDKAVTGSKDFYSYQVRAMYETRNSGTAYGTWSTAWHFNNGKIVFDGYQTINGNKYYYKNGVIQKNGIVGSSKEGYCYADKNGKIDTSYRGAITSNGADWIVQNGKATKVTTASDRNLFRAMKLVAQLTTKNMTNEQKLRVCFDYLKGHYTEMNPRIPHYTGMDWPIIYANDILANGQGNCFSYAAVFCYMAKAIGYTNIYACTSGGHAWAEVNGLVYDPEWARHRFGYSYFGMSYNTKCDVDYKGGISPGKPWMHVKV